jgi:simple sugar transport system permease protein
VAKKALSPEERSEKRMMILTPIIAVLLALIIGAIIIACLGKNPLEGYAAMIQGSLGDGAKLSKTLERACPLIFTGLCAAFAYKCGVFNLGGEGQFIMGGCATAMCILGLGLEGPRRPCVGTSRRHSCRCHLGAPAGHYEDHPRPQRDDHHDYAQLRGHVLYGVHLQERLLR